MSKRSMQEAEDRSFVEIRYRRSPRAPWWPSEKTFGGEAEGALYEAMVMAGMARCSSLVACCSPLGEIQDIQALTMTCTRWQLAMLIGVEILRGQRVRAALRGGGLS